MVLDMPVCMVDTMDMDSDTMESVLLKPSPKLKLILTFCMVDTMDMVLDMPVCMVDTTDMDSDTMARDLLKPSPRLLLTPTCCTVDMVLDMPDTMDMDTHMLDMVASDKLALP